MMNHRSDAASRSDDRVARGAGRPPPGSPPRGTSRRCGTRAGSRRAARPVRRAGDRWRGAARAPVLGRPANRLRMCTRLSSTEARRSSAGTTAARPVERFGAPDQLGQLGGQLRRPGPAAARRSRRRPEGQSCPQLSHTVPEHNPCTGNGVAAHIVLGVGRPDTSWNTTVARDRRAPDHREGGVVNLANNLMRSTERYPDRPAVRLDGRS